MTSKKAGDSMLVENDIQGRWYVKYPDQEGRIVTKYFGRGAVAFREAEAFANRESETQAHMSKNQIASGKKPTMLSLMPTLKADFLLNGRTTRYVNDLERVVKRSGLGHKQIKQLTLRDFGHYADLNPTTRNRYLSYIKVVLNYAVREELIEKNPLWKWTKPKEKSRKNPLTQEDLDKIKAVAVPHLRWAIEVAQNLGVRCGKTELFSLRWTDVNYEHKYIQVYARKTKTWRQVPFTQRFGLQLKAMQNQARTEYICEYWSTKRNIARPIERIHKSWRTALVKAGIKYRCVFYDVRHLYASKLLNRGADLLSVSALLGHASTKMTADVYGHASAQGMRRAVSLLEDPEESSQE